MRYSSLAAIVLFSLATVAVAEEKPSGDIRSFELTPSAPPTPALKYQLLFDDLGDRRPGNAAILYLDAILLMGPDAADKSSDALDAYEAKATEKFAALAHALELPQVFQELDLAGRRERCEWEPPFREMGAYTLLPHLSPLAHAMTNLIKVRALRQMEEGKVEDAVKTLRLGYEMSDKVGNEGILISGLVAIRISSQMNDALATLMNRPDASNMYWALSELPSRRSIFRRSMDGERQWWVTSFPNLFEVGQGRDLAMMAKSGIELSADQWRSLIVYVWDLVESNPTKEKAKRPDPVKDATADTLRHAREQYAQRHKLSEEQVAKLDPMIVLGAYYFSQYEAGFDEMFKLRGLPYPELISKAKEVAAEMDKLQKANAANPFLSAMVPVMPIVAFAKADRQMAALTAVEALRSYAAAHDGKLPKELSEITATPVPQNPMTGKPFEYKLDGATATVSDTTTDEPLKYTVTIRK